MFDLHQPFCAWKNTPEGICTTKNEKPDISRQKKHRLKIPRYGSVRINPPQTYAAPKMGTGKPLALLHCAKDYTQGIIYSPFGLI
jgi:hypothetical protein